jgi:hypothetical protein
MDLSRGLAIDWWHRLDDFEREDVREWWRDHSLPFPRREAAKQVEAALVPPGTEVEALTPTVEDFLRRWQPGWELAVDWWCSISEDDRAQLLGSLPRVLISDHVKDSLEEAGFQIAPPITDMATSRYRLPDPVLDLVRWIADYG